MANVIIESAGSGVPTPLQSILAANDIQPGAQISYELCKLLYEFHPLAGKIIEKPVALALNKPRKIEFLSCAFEEELREAFETEWTALDATRHIRDVMHLSRVYGAAAIAYGSPNIPTDQRIDPWALAETPDLYFNHFDPLNLSGSIVTNQNPNAPDFQKSWQTLTAAGQPYHRSRTRLLFCGTPIYLAFQGSSYSFSGRSLFQRALYPLKSFIQTMTVNDMVSLKAGLLIANLKQPGAITNLLMAQAAGAKRNLVKEGQTGNVLSIQLDEVISSIDLNNTDKAMTVARDNIISDIGSATDVPALLLKDEAFTNGFGEGKEDSKQVAMYLEGIRNDAMPLVEYFDAITQYRAWNKQLYAALAETFPDEVGKMSYEQFFYYAKKRFKAAWPSLLEEPQSEIIKRNADKLKSVSDLVKTLITSLDPPNRALLVGWVADNVSQMTDLFQSPLEFDLDSLAEYEPPQPGGDDEEGVDKDAKADAAQPAKLSRVK